MQNITKRVNNLYNNLESEKAGLTSNVPKSKHSERNKTKVERAYLILAPVHFVVNIIVSEDIER